ncbi:MAG: hypothetical protein ABUK19_00690 [Desulfobacteria bacterium]
MSTSTGYALQAEKDVPGPCPWVNLQGEKARGFMEWSMWITAIATAVIAFYALKTHGLAERSYQFFD